MNGLRLLAVLALANGIATPAALAQVTAVGAWFGVLKTPGGELTLVVTIRVDEAGRLQGDLESRDQAPGQKIPLTSVSVEGAHLRFAIDALGVSYTGEWVDAENHWTGVFTQGVGLSLTLLRGEPPARAARVRPQTPRPPFPYRAEEVTFANTSAAGVMLAGTLTLPPGNGPFPAAVLITGSGAQDRDQTILEHKPFAVLADHLTRHGIAVLRYDDRGVGRSTGDFAAATSADFATDASAAIRYLMSRAEIRRDAIGFIGHSEGGMVGPLAAADNDDVAFVVMLAGPGTNVAQLLLSQRRLIGMSEGVTEADLARAEPIMLQVFAAVAEAPTTGEARDRVRAALTSEALQVLAAAQAVPGDAGADPAREMVLQLVANDWFRYFVQYDPSAVLSRVGVPVLALNGSLDHQTPADENLAAISTALAGNPDVTVRKLEGLNHLFQTSVTGAPSEYAEITETMSPVVLGIIVDWITARFAR